jgi:hypothetical protein
MLPALGNEMAMTAARRVGTLNRLRPARAGLGGLSISGWERENKRGGPGEGLIRGLEVAWRVVVWSRLFSLLGGLESGSSSLLLSMAICWLGGAACHGGEGLIWGRLLAG